MKIFVVIISLFFALAFISCNQVNTSQPEYKYDYGYFPVNIGDWREYQVLYVNIDKALDIFDTTAYYIREEVKDIYIDGVNDTMYEVYRFYRDSIHHNWEVNSVWYAGIKGAEAIQVEGNVRYVKQKLPLKIDKIWNGNAYNRNDTLEEYLCHITQIDFPETINNIAFDSVLKISQREFLSSIQKYSYFEKYAYNIGLVEKEEVYIYTEDADISIPIEQRAEKATMYYQKIVDYGKAQ